MNPKPQTNQPLDPKLKEAYDRVMGISLSDDHEAISPTPMPSSIPDVTTESHASIMPEQNMLDVNTQALPDPLAQSISQTTPILSTSPEPSIPTVVSEPTLPINPTLQQNIPQDPQQDQNMQPLQSTVSLPKVSQHDTETINIGAEGSPVAVSMVSTKHKGISPIILIVAAVSFLIVYGVFWVRFFNYSLPFLPK